MEQQAAQVDQGEWGQFIAARQRYHDARNAVVLRYAGFVESILARAMRHLPPRVSRDELRSELNLELLKLLDKFDGSGPLTAYARPRLTGALIDLARRQRILRGRERSLEDLIRSGDGDG
jgi:RNA polymerase sigma factor (sigma-70 family)